MAGILTALFGATACGNAETKVVYQYPETAVSDDNLRITKTVYTPGKMKLYYTGKRFHDNWILCYDANFNQLSGEYQCKFERNALTIEADFAERISGLVINDSQNGAIYHLRYLDSPQFAWMMTITCYDGDPIEWGDREKYYTKQELQQQEDSKKRLKQRTMEVYELLKGRWISDDGKEKYEITLSESEDYLYVENSWYRQDEERWEGDTISVDQAYIEKDTFLKEENGLKRITLVNANRSAAGVQIIYDQQKQEIQIADTTYHKE